MRGAVKNLLIALMVTLLPFSGLDAARIKVKPKIKPKIKASVKTKIKPTVKAKVKPTVAPKTPAKKASAWTVADGTAKVRGTDGVVREIAPTKVAGKNAAFVPEGKRVGSSWTTKDGVVKQKISDGSVMNIHPDGTRTRVFSNGRRITVLPDGTAVSTNALGQKFIRTPDGKLIPVGKSVKPNLPGKASTTTPVPDPIVTPPAGGGIKTRHVVAGAAGLGLLLWPTELGDGTMRADLQDDGTVILRPPVQGDQDQDQDRPAGDDAIPGLDEGPAPVIRRPNHDQDQDQDQDGGTASVVIPSPAMDEVPGLTGNDNGEQEAPTFGEDLIIQRRVRRNGRDQDQDQDQDRRSN